MAGLAPLPKFSASDAVGVPLVGGKLYSYAAGTSTPLATYSDYTGNTPNANPVVLDTRGEANVWLGEGLYKLVLRDALDNIIWTVDNVAGNTTTNGVALANYATVRALNGFRPDYIYVKGVQASGDGGEGIFRLDSSDTTTADNGGTVLVDASGRRWKRVYDSNINVRWFGAKGNGVTDDLTAIQLATSAVANITLDAGIYVIGSNYTLPRACSWTFENGARIYVKAGVVVTILGKVFADEDQWIFDCADNPTNYSDPNNYRGAGAVTTATPIILGGSFYSAGGFAGAVSVKWFGATGAGYTDPSALSAYESAQTIPSNMFVNDTKAIRFALTAICGDYQWIDLVGSQRGVNGLFFPDGVYTVDDDLFFGGIALYGSTPQSPILGCKIIQTNADKNLFVVQSAGRGGLGGSGSSFQLVNLTPGYRFTNWQSSKNLATVYFVENKFLLDGYITGCRFSNIGYQQSVFYWNQKEARSAVDPGNPQYGYGSESGLLVTMHINQCMFDVGIGRAFRIGSHGAGEVEINDSLFFDYPQGFIYDEQKNTAAGAAADGGKVKFKCTNVDFQDVGQFYLGATGDLPNENFMYSRNAGGFYWFDDCKNRTHRAGYGGAFNIEGGGLRMKGCFWDQTPTGSGANIAFFLRSNGTMSELTLIDNKLSLVGATYQMMELGSSFAPSALNIQGNVFLAPSSSCIISTNNPASLISGVARIADNYFGAVGTQPIIGNTNPNIIYDGNVFATAQDVKSISLRNYGMKGRTEIYDVAAPVSGAWYRGDRVINSTPTVGQPKTWVCTVSGSPGTWVSEGNL